MKEDARPAKVAVVEEVRANLGQAEATIVTEYRGLKVRELETLREQLAPAGVTYKVYKNTLVRFAAVDLGLEIEDLLEGPTAIAFTGTRADGTAGDVVAMAKVLSDFGRGHDRLVIKGGLLSGRRLSAAEVAELAKIAPREELLARIAGGLAAPMRNFAGLLQAVPQRFAGLLQALIDAGGASGEPAAAAAGAPAAEAEPEAAEASETTEIESIETETPDTESTPEEES
jgi:large subunit ribosomal protein L10